MMKKIFIGCVVLSLAACNDSGNASSSEDTTITKTSGVENVNGNIPDTTNTISVEGSAQATDDAVDTTKNK